MRVPRVPLRRRLLGGLAWRLALLSGGAMALSGAARAQNVPKQFVLSEKAAEKTHDFTTINLATAERIAESCEEAVIAKGTAAACTRSRSSIRPAIMSTWIAWMGRATSISLPPR